MLHPTRRLLAITALVLLLHGVVIGAVVRLLGHEPIQPPDPLPPAVVSVGRIEVASATTAPQPAAQRAPSHPSQPVPTQGMGGRAPSTLEQQAQPVSSQAATQASASGTPVSGAAAGQAAMAQTSGDIAVASARGADGTANSATASASAAIEPAAAPAVAAQLRLAELQEPLEKVYPPLSRVRGERGTVIVRVLIGADGRVLQAKVGTSSGYPRLDQAAVDSVRGGRFRPTQRGDTTQDGWYDHPVRFDFDR